MPPQGIMPQEHQDWLMSHVDWDHLKKLSLKHHGTTYSRLVINNYLRHFNVQGTKTLRKVRGQLKLCISHSRIFGQALERWFRNHSPHNARNSSRDNTPSAGGSGLASATQLVTKPSFRATSPRDMFIILHYDDIEGGVGSADFNKEVSRLMALLSDVELERLEILAKEHSDSKRAERQAEQERSFGAYVSFQSPYRLKLI